MADSDAEEAFLKSMKEIGDSTGAFYGAVGADGKQTESTSSDEYDPAQALPATLSPLSAQDPPEQIKSSATVNLSPFQQPSTTPLTAGTGKLPADTQEHVSDGDRSQSRSMSGSSTSSLPTANHISSNPQPSTATTNNPPISAQIGEDWSNSNGPPVVNKAPQSSNAISLTTSNGNNVPSSTFQSPNNVSFPNSSSFVQNGVSPTVSNVTAVHPLGSESRRELSKEASPGPKSPARKPKSVKVENVPSSVSTAASRARLPHDRIGILEDRIKEDPRGDIDSWLSLIGEHRKRGKLDDARNVYERFFSIFPSAAEQWVAYAQMENEANNQHNMEKIFHRTLMSIPHLQLWSLYLDHVRRLNNLTTDSSGQARQTIHQAYELALKQIGLDKESGKIWQDYILFIKSGPGIVGGSTWQDQQKMDWLRKAYHAAIRVPTQVTNMFWKEYDTFEMSLSKTTGRKFLQDQSPPYMTARGCYIELQNITRNLRRSTLPLLPPALGFAGDREYSEQLDIWKRWIKWEKDDPLMLKQDEIQVYRERVCFVYKQALMAMRFWPEIWFDAAEFCFQNSLEPLGNEFLTQGIAANPESCLLAFKRADRLELTSANDEGDEGAKRRGAAVREPYDKVLDALYELIHKAKEHEKLEIERIEAQFVSEDNNQNGINSAENDEDDNEDRTDTKEKRKAAKTEAIKGVSAMQIRLLSKTISSVWIALMRAMRRVQGKGKVNEAIGGSRQIFTDARKRGRILSDVYVASAMIEFHCYDPEATKKIFERGLKLFPEDEGFALEYIKHLIATNDHINARVVFETVVSKLGQKPESLPRAKPLYAFFHDFESRYGEISQIVKLEKRMRDLFPDDPALSHFSRRFSQPSFDPTAVRPLISPATQMRPKNAEQAESVIPTKESPPSQQATFKDSPKRPLPFEDSDNEVEPPRKLARGESPLKGAAGRRLDQHKRIQQSQGTPQLDQASAPVPPPPSLPRDILFLLSIIPKRELYGDTFYFPPKKIVEIMREVEVRDNRNDRNQPPPGGSQHRMPIPIQQQMPPQSMPSQQIPPQPAVQRLPQQMQPIQPTGFFPNAYNGGLSSSSSSFISSFR
ncbi:MAG: hypothetical protein Q9214_001910 [Letrouitia sp. 1 TL-2023]